MNKVKSQRYGYTPPLVKSYHYSGLGHRVAKESDSFAFDEFGQILSGTFSPTQPFTFTGYQQDNIANTYYGQAREYMPKNARFVSEDIVKGSIFSPVTLNTYTYCISNPLKYVDPDGNVIKLRGNPEQNRVMLQGLNKLTDFPLIQGVDGTVEVGLVPFAPTTTNHFPQGNELVGRMIASDKVVEVHKFNSPSRFNVVPNSLTDASNGVGTGSVISVNRTHQALNQPIVPTVIVPEADANVGQHIPFHIAFGHELIHADRAMRGVLIDPNQLTDHRYIYLDVIPRNASNEVKTLTEHTPLEELATIGLGGFHTPSCVTENGLRREQGLPLRGAYSFPEKIINRILGR